MHPNTFLKTFWRLELRPQVFVAMSFAPEHETRFRNVFAPAVESIQVEGVSLQPIRVDLSRSGDSILTEISDGIAHSRLVLADVSSIGRDSVTGQPYRNGNVMYEVGLALACRLPHEVLLVRDDSDHCLFDVSTIPHKKIDFTDASAARRELVLELRERMHQANYVSDARVQMAIAGLTSGEIDVLRQLSALPPGHAIQNEPAGNVAGMVSIPRLLDKQLIRSIGRTHSGGIGYIATPLGTVVMHHLKAALANGEA